MALKNECLQTIGSQLRSLKRKRNSKNCENDFGNLSFVIWKVNRMWRHNFTFFLSRRTRFGLDVPAVQLRHENRARGSSHRRRSPSGQGIHFFNLSNCSKACVTRTILIPDIAIKSFYDNFIIFSQKFILTKVKSWKNPIVLGLLCFLRACLGWP